MINFRYPIYYMLYIMMINRPSLTLETTIVVFKILRFFGRGTKSIYNCVTKSVKDKPIPIDEGWEILEREKID